MKDERIIREMNQIKGFVFIYVFIATLILTLLKLLLKLNQFSYFYVEIFVLVVTLITFAIIGVLRSNDIDERIENQMSQTYKIGYVFLVIGGLWVHFYQVLTNFSRLQVSIYITNSLILIGFIVTVVLLKKKKLYANYKYIEYDKKTYYKHIAVNIIYLLLMFVVIYLTTRFATGIQVNDDISLAYLLVVALSFVMISIEYLIFTIYEKNHYDEMISFDVGKPNYLSKNVFVFQVILFIMSTISLYIGLQSQLVLMMGINEHIEAFQYWASINRINSLMSIDGIILALIAALITYYYLKKLVGLSIVLKLYFWFIWVNFMFNILMYIFNLIAPLISASNNYELLIQIYTTYNKIVAVLMIIFLVFNLGFVVFLIIKNIKFKWMLFIYLLLVIVTSYPIKSLILPSDSSLMAYLGFSLSLIKGLFFLVLIWLYTHEAYPNYKNNQESDEVYDPVLAEA